MKLFRGSTPTLQTLLDQGRNALRDKNLQAAEATLAQAVSLGFRTQQLAELYTLLGQRYQKQNKYEAAQAAFSTAIDIDNNYAPAWNNQGILHRLRDNLDEAEKCYQRALEIQPDYAYAMASLGALYVFKKAPHQAIEVLGNALALIPSIAIAHANLALAQAMVGNFNEANKSLHQATTLGYQNTKVIQARISALQALAQSNTPSRDASWLPSDCLRCSAPISPTTVNWTSDTTADCAYCGGNITKP